MKSLLNILISGLLITLSTHAKAQPVPSEKFNFEVLHQDQDVIWGFDFISQDEVIMTLRRGTIKKINLKTNAVQIIQGTPTVWTMGQGGLLDVRVHPNQKDQIYFTYAEPSGNKGSTAFATAKIVNGQLKDFKKIFVSKEPTGGGLQFGSRIEFDQNGFVYVSIGDRNVRPRVQDLSYFEGKVLRFTLNGDVPTDNPFVGKPGASPEVWTLGHRNPQGLTLNPKTNQLWLSELGPQGGDEINLLAKGNNYGWPDVTYGKEYSGEPIGVTHKVGTVQPITYWVPSISPSGIGFYFGDKFQSWKGNLFVGTMSGNHLRRLVLDGEKIIDQEVLLEDMGERFRNVRTGTDGYVYVSTDSGKLARLTPKK